MTFTNEIKLNIHMRIFFKHKNTDIPAHLESFMANRIRGIAKFFSHDAHAYIDVEKTSTSHHGNDLFYVSIRLRDAGHEFFTEEYADDIRKAFDRAYAENYRVIRKQRSRLRDVSRKAGSRLKRIFRRGKTNF